MPEQSNTLIGVAGDGAAVDGQRSGGSTCDGDPVCCRGRGRRRGRDISEGHAYGGVLHPDPRHAVGGDGAGGVGDVHRS